MTLSNEIWDEDKLDRKASADYLTAYLNALFAEEESKNEIYKSSFVLNVNAGWGYGKTFFIEKWVQDLNANNQPAIYFDAWKTDFAEDPLLAFIAELQDSLKPYLANVPKGTQILKATFEAAKEILKPVIINQINTIVSTATGGIIPDINPKKQDNLVDASLKAYKDKKIAIETFKKKLNDLVSALKVKSSLSLPIYIFIDELDRCRPTYAVSLLESIKHIFGVNGFYFIVATNKNELAHSVKAIYGMDFDALTYLRRFFDQEYVLPKPNNDKFAVYLTEKYRLTSGGTVNYYSPISPLPGNETLSSIAATFSMLATGLEVSLRDQMQIAAQLKSIVLITKYKTIHILYLIFIMMLRQKGIDALDKFLNPNMRSEEYEKLMNKNLNFNGFVPTDNYGSRPEKITLADALEIYRKNAGINSISLYNYQSKGGTLANIYTKLLEEAPHSHQPSKHYPLSISSYPDLVLQSGQLII